MIKRRKKGIIWSGSILNAVNTIIYYVHLWFFFTVYTICPNLLNLLIFFWEQLYFSISFPSREMSLWSSLWTFCCRKIVAAFQGMHVSPAKHNFGKCDRRTDRQTDGRTDGQTDGRRTKWSLCVAMLQRRHEKGMRVFNPLPFIWVISGHFVVLASHCYFKRC